GRDVHVRQRAVRDLLLEAPRAPDRVVVEPAVVPRDGLTRERAPHVVEVGAAAHAGDDVDELVADRRRGLGAARVGADAVEDAWVLLGDGEHRGRGHGDGREGTPAVVARVAAVPRIALEQARQVLGEVALERHRVGVAGVLGLDVRVRLLPVRVVREGAADRGDGPGVLVAHEFLDVGLRLPGRGVFAAAGAVDQV